ncbi:MAG: hypothetical protein JNN05_01640, partial [Candidatus Omnitrophica bacterium]|nr:hypothetical protein [Candidatus Omnitrophota bacterium]
MRSFSMVDQYGFARLSGDYNKMHVDAVAARRFMFGRPVVHGIHLVLFALEEWAKLFKQPFTVASLKVNFRKPLLVEDSVHLQVKEESAGRVCLKLLRNEDLLTEINVC